MESSLPSLTSVSAAAAMTVLVILEMHHGSGVIRTKQWEHQWVCADAE